MKVEKYPEYVPMKSDEEATLTFTGEELRLITSFLHHYDTLLFYYLYNVLSDSDHCSFSSCPLFKLIYNHPLDDIVKDAYNIHILYSELIKVYDLPF